MQKINEVKYVLKRLYNPTGNERCGFVLLNNEIVEVQNICNNPKDGFLISTLDIRKYIETGAAVASWHTHPEKDANLSGEDYRCFRAYPQLCHFILGSDGVRCFQYDKEKESVLEKT